MRQNIHTMLGEGPFSDAKGSLDNADATHEEDIRAHVFFRQALHVVNLSWRVDAERLSHVMVVSVSPLGVSGSPTSVWEGQYSSAFLQQLTARTGSPLAPRGLWELLTAAVRAAEEDTRKTTCSSQVAEHSTTAGVFLNLWSSAELDALKRRGVGEGPQDVGANQSSADASKLFLIVTRALEGRRVHYPLALTQKEVAVRAEAPISAADAIRLPLRTTSSPIGSYVNTTAAARATLPTPTQPQKYRQTPLSVDSVQTPQERHRIVLPQQEQAFQHNFNQQTFDVARKAAGNASGDAKGLHWHVQPGSCSPRHSLQHHRNSTPGVTVHLQSPVGDEDSAASVGILADQQTARADAPRYKAPCSQEVQATNFEGGSVDPQGLTAQLHRVEAELFMARQRLHTERQLRAREAQRFRLEIDKIRRTEASLRIRVRELEAQLRSNNCSQKRSVVTSSSTVPSTIRSSSSRCSSSESNGAARRRDTIGCRLDDAFQGRSRAPALCTRMARTSRCADSSSVGERDSYRFPTASSHANLSKLSSQSGARRGRSCSPYIPRPPASGRLERGGPEGRSERPVGVSASLLASTASSRARQRSNSVTSCSSNNTYNASLNSPCSCNTSRPMGLRNNQGLARASTAYSQLRYHPHPDWRLSRGRPSTSWEPLNQNITVVSSCYRHAVRKPSTCSVHSHRVPIPNTGVGLTGSYGNRSGVSSPLELVEDPRGARGSRWPVDRCYARDKSPFAAEAICEEDALLPPTGMPNAHQQQQQRQHLQPPFVVLSAAEYEMLREKSSTEQKEGRKESEAAVEPLLPFSTHKECLVLPKLMRRPQGPADDGTGVDSPDKVEVEDSVASSKEGSSTLATASASEAATAEAMPATDEPSLSTHLRTTDTASTVVAPPSTLLPNQPPTEVTKHHAKLGDLQLTAPVTQAISTSKELRAGKAVFSEIDERLTALQKFLRSTRENFRIMETGTLGA